MQIFFLKMTVRFGTAGTVQHLTVHKAASVGGQKCAELPFCFSACKMAAIIELNLSWVDKRVELEGEI